MVSAFLYDGQSESVQQAAAAALAAVAAALARNLTASGANATAALAADLPALTALAPDSQAAYAAQLQLLLADYVAGIVADAAAAAAPNPPPPAGYQFSSRLPPTPSDPSYGLAALAALGTALTAPAAATGQAAANWSALMLLVEGSATAALAVLYAQTGFAASADADNAREQIFNLIVAQIEAAAGNDALVQAWRGQLTASVGDLTARASGLPNVATLATPTPMPALVLAELVYQDGSQAAALVQRNAAPHPLFMPMSIEYLAA